VNAKSRLLDPNSPLPLYFQLQEDIRGRIESGEYEPATLLPTEGDLRAMYGVSRATVREALRGLADRGLVEKRQGVGTFVSAKKISEKLPGVTSFSTEMRLRGYGYAVRSDVLNKDYVEPPRRISSLLELEEDSQVLRVRRLRYVDNKPFLISISYLPPFISIEDDFTGSIYQLLHTKYNLQVAGGEVSIEAGIAEEEEANLLGIASTDAVLRINWLGQTLEGQYVEYSEGTYRGDCYRYIIQLPR
jgi:GntR family transcriptional regulator